MKQRERLATRIVKTSLLHVRDGYVSNKTDEHMSVIEHCRSKDLKNAKRNRRRRNTVVPFLDALRNFCAIPICVGPTGR